MLKSLFKQLVSSTKKIREDEIDPLSVARKFALEGNLAGAWGACQAARDKYGESADLLAFEGGLFGIQGCYEDARRLLKAALSLDPNHEAAHTELANIEYAEGNFADAALHYQAALAGNRDNCHVLTNLGQVERARGNWAEAERYLLEALSFDEQYSPALDLLFSIYDESEEYDKAIDLVGRLLATSSKVGRWLHMQGFLMYKRQFLPAAADALFDQAEQAGESSLAFWVDRGICARDLGDAERAEQFLLKAREIDPCNPLPIFHLGLLRLYQQRYAEGWDAYEIRLDDQHWLNTKLPAPRWQGESLEGRPLLVKGEQGVGDEIMFASCLESLPADAEIYGDCAEKLMPLFKNSFPKISWLSKEGLLEIASKRDSVAVPIGSLPQLYRRDISQFPRSQYLRAPEDACSFFRCKLSEFSGIKVGISWRGGTEITRKRLRSLSLSEVGKFGSLQGVTWFNLQYGDTSAELSILREQHGMSIEDVGIQHESFERLAALTTELDLVVSVDTTMVHLAGALGRKVLALIPRVPEWRYGFSTTQIPWYPNVDILRQETSGCWDEPIEKALDYIRAYIARR